MSFTVKQLQDLKAAGRIKGYREGPATKQEAGPGKYRNKKVVVQGIEFDSKKEAARYMELKALKMSGEIYNLFLQVEFQLSVCKYVADFTYQVSGTDELIVEDVKSAATRKNRAYRLKNKLMLHELGIKIKEV